MKNGKIKLSRLSVESFSTSIETQELKGGNVNEISGRARTFCSYTVIPQYCGYIATKEPCPG